jgi:hypothetical protein
MKLLVRQLFLHPPSLPHAPKLSHPAGHTWRGPALSDSRRRPRPRNARQNHNSWCESRPTSLLCQFFLYVCRPERT